MQAFLDGWISCCRCVDMGVECDDKRPQRSDCHQLHQLGAGRADWERWDVRVAAQRLQL